MSVGVFDVLPEVVAVVDDVVPPDVDDGRAGWWEGMVAGVVVVVLDVPSAP